MTPDQEKAARSLRGALRKVRDAGLSLYVYDGSVSVCPTDTVNPQMNGGGDCFDIIADHGEDCTPIGLNADGGAGT